MPRILVIGFGLVMGSIIAQIAWPETDRVAIPITCIGAGMMTFALLAPRGDEK